MFLKKRSAFSLVSFVLIFILFFVSFKPSFAADCNSSGGLCVPNESKYTGECTSTDPTLTGCIGNGICCLGGPTCASKGGTCGSTGSCTNGTIDYFRCEGGTNNVCCIIPQPTLPFTQPTVAIPDQQKLADEWRNEDDEMYNPEKPNVGQLYVKGMNIALHWCIDALKGREINPFSNTTAYVPGGIIGVVNNGIASLFTPPASGIQYLAELKDNFFGKPAYAQGTGFTGLQAILPIWRGFRNTTYIFFSLIFIVIGIMIMLRIKISPQAVITIQSAIPKLITALILVTFSYAIAGLMIDLAYFIENLALVILFQTQAGGLTSTLLPSANSPGTFASYTQGGIGMALGLMWRALPFTSIAGLGSALSGIAGGIAGGAGAIAFLGTGAVAGGWAALIGVALFLLIILIIMVIWLIKFWFALLKCYVMIIFKIIIAPLEIGLGAIPILKVGFTSWFIDLIAYLSVFPVCYLVLIIGNILIDKTTGASLWVPHLLSFGGGLISAAIGLALLGLISKLPDLIVGAFKQFKKNVFASAIGETYGAIGKGKIGKFATQGAYESMGQTITDRWGSVQYPSRMGKFAMWAKDAAESAGLIKEKRPRTP